MFASGVRDIFHAPIQIQDRRKFLMNQNFCFRIGVALKTFTKFAEIEMSEKRRLQPEQHLQQKSAARANFPKTKAAARTTFLLKVCNQATILMQMLILARNNYVF